jgi:hypothetical protein
VLGAFAGNVHVSDIGMPDLVGLRAVIMALGVFAAVRRGALPAQRLLDVGLVLQVIGALGLAVREFSHGLPPMADGCSSCQPNASGWWRIRSSFPTRR